MVKKKDGGKKNKKASFPFAKKQAFYTMHRTGKNVPF